MSLILHSYWRSSAAYRVRIGLNLKGLDYEIIPQDLRTDAHKGESYRAINPQGLVPCLIYNGQAISQSGAILWWLDEAFPEPALLPKADPMDRARIRAYCDMIACDIHPLNNLRVLRALRGDFSANQDQVDHWAQTWLSSGLGALEEALANDPQRRAPLLDMLTCYLVPQLYSARRFHLDLTPYPLLLEIEAHALTNEAVIRAHPDQQQDADPS